MYEILDWQRHFLLLSKQAGVGMHRAGEDLGLIRRLQADYPEERLLPVHRLDKVTSGLLLMARHRNAARELARQFQAGKVDKYYLALSNRPPKQKQGWVVGDMEPSRRGTWRLTRSRSSPAITRFLSYSVQPGLRLFVLQPFTGRTHQIRVVMKSLGAPILGDPLYAKASRDIPDADRCYLHAFALRFAMRGQTYTPTRAPESGRHFLSPQFMDLLPGLARPWDLPWPPQGRNLAMP